MRVDTTDQATDDLVEAALFIAKDSISAAERFVIEVTRRYRLLAESPGLGRPREDLGPGLRSLPFKSYIIFYREIPDGVQIVRFLSGYRDLEALF
jgi:toxin ParE1/3/4